MKNYKVIDRLITKYLIVSVFLVIVILKHEFILEWLMQLIGILSPIIYGAMAAYVINLPMQFFERYYFPNHDEEWVNKTRRPVSILLALISVIIIITFVVSLVLPQLIEVVRKMVDIAPYIAREVRDWLQHLVDTFPELGNYIDLDAFDLQSIIGTTANNLNAFVTALVSSTFTTVISVFGTLMNFVFSIMITLYILMSKETLGHQFRKIIRVYFSPKVEQRLIYVLEVLNETFTGFIIGTGIESLILGTFVTVGMMIFRFPYAGMIGVLTGVSAVIPVVGALLAGGIGFILILMQSVLQGFMFLLFILVVQQIESNLIYPRVVGHSIGLPGLWVLVAVTIGGGLSGIMGMMLAVPIASTLYKLLRNNVKERDKIDRKEKHPPASVGLG